MITKCPCSYGSDHGSDPVSQDNYWTFHVLGHPMSLSTTFLSQAMIDQRSSVVLWSPTSIAAFPEKSLKISSHWTEIVNLDAVDLGRCLGAPMTGIVEGRTETRTSSQTTNCREDHNGQYSKAKTPTVSKRRRRDSWCCRWCVMMAVLSTLVLRSFP